MREFPLKTGFADYLLFVDRRAIGAIEAKPEGTTLTGVEAQAEKYSVGLSATQPAWHSPLPFLYESTGVETFFTNGLDPEPRSRRTFAFHRPEDLSHLFQATINTQGCKSRILTSSPFMIERNTGPRFDIKVASSQHGPRASRLSKATSIKPDRALCD